MSDTPIHPSIHPEPTPRQRYEAALGALGPRQRRFVVEYLATLNAAEAARRAGYSERTARSIGHENLTKPDIALAIAAGFDLEAMPAAEVLARMTRIARGSIADVLRLPPATYEEAAATKAADGVTPLPTPADAWALDLIKAQQTGAIDLIESMKDTEHGTAFKMYSKFDALVKIGEYHKLWGKGADLMKLIDLTKLSDAQLDRLAEGEDPIKVLLG